MFPDFSITKTSLVIVKKANLFCSSMNFYILLTFFQCVHKAGLHFYFKRFKTAETNKPKKQTAGLNHHKLVSKSVEFLCNLK